MYYITNHTDQIIAVDNSLLDLLNMESIEALSKQLILGDIHFTPLTEKSISIVTEQKSLNFDMQTSVLSSLMGDFTLVHLEMEATKDDDTSIFTFSDENEIKDSLLQEEETEDTPNETLIPEDDDLIFIKDTLSIAEETEAHTIQEKEEKEETFSLEMNEKPFMIDEEDELFDLTIHKVPEETIEEITLDTVQIAEPEPFVAQEVEEKVPDTTPIIIDLTKVSESIGISDEDYTTFLNEYIDTAISLETDLQSTQTEKRSAAISTLTQLADVLQLPFVNDIMSKLSTLSTDNSKDTIESFYATLSRLTTEKDDVETVKPLTQAEPSIQEELILVDKPLGIKEKNNEGFGTIDLEGIKPIHFDFQLEAAANDLSLPVELIEEFVHDFIDQAHIETEKMLAAYEKGDLDTIQKIGHLLKGASSNLRINPLSDTLYEIQFCEDSSNLDALIKRYWGQFLAFEQQIDILSK